jgi:hypothetical protein
LIKIRKAVIIRVANTAMIVFPLFFTKDILSRNNFYSVFPF